MSFDRPVPDLAEIVAAWEASERGEQQPGRVLAELAASDWSPAAPTA